MRGNIFYNNLLNVLQKRPNELTEAQVAAILNLERDSLVNFISSTTSEDYFTTQKTIEPLDGTPPTITLNLPDGFIKMNTVQYKREGGNLLVIRKRDVDVDTLSRDPSFINNYYSLGSKTFILHINDGNEEPITEVVISFQQYPCDFTAQDLTADNDLSHISSLPQQTHSALFWRTAANFVMRDVRSNITRQSGVIINRADQETAAMLNIISARTSNELVLFDD